MRLSASLALVIIAAAAPAQAFNFLENSAFSDDLSGWDQVGHWTHNPTAGVFGQLGSAEITSPAAGNYSLSQCVDISAVTGGRTVTVAAFTNTVNHGSAVGIDIELFDTADCSGLALKIAGDNRFSPPLNAYTGLYVPIPLPIAGAQRALVRLEVSNTAASQTTQFDIASLRYDLLVGADFNTDLLSWIQTPPGSWQIVAGGLTTPSGVAEATVAADGSVFLSQCLLVDDIPGTSSYSSWIRIKALDELADYQLSFQFYDNQICAPPGNLLFVHGLLTRPATLNQWAFFFTDVPRPIGAQSVAVFVALNPGAGTPGTQFRIDDFIMTAGDGVFSDGFETADTTAWSATLP